MKDDELYLVHIRECIARVKEYTAAGRAAFDADTRTQDAVIRNLQVLAESCTRLSPQVRARHSEIDWHAIAGFRNVLVHDYVRIELNRIWQVVEQDLSPLLDAIERAMRELTPPEDG